MGKHKGGMKNDPNRETRRSMIHLNGNVLCVIDCETSGSIPGIHDLIQICILPLDADLKPWRGINPFYMDLQPKRPENWDPDDVKTTRTRFCEAKIKGMNPDQACTLFDEWFAKLAMPPGKRISPLAQNWPFDREFIIDWLGRESVHQYFDARYRDTMAGALLMNDIAYFRVNTAPYAKVNLTWLAKTHDIPHERAHDALADCVVTAEVYRQMIKAHY